MIKLVGQVGDGVGQARDSHDAVHQLKMTRESTDIGIITLFLRSLEIEDRFLFRLNHA